MGEYEYPRYFFSNHRNIAVSHRTNVARLEEFVGPKR